MRVSAPVLTRSPGFVEVSFRVERESKTPRRLWFRVSGNRPISDGAAGCAVAAGLLIPAMHFGENLEIGCPVNQGFLKNLMSSQELLKMLIPSLREISVRSASDSAVQRDKTNVNTPLIAFSGGVDSLYVLSEKGLLGKEEVGVERPQAGMLFTNTGQHGRSKTLFYERARRARRLPKLLGYELTIVDSNLEDHFPRELGFQQTHTLRNLSVAALLSDHFSEFNYAAGYQYVPGVVPSSRDLASIDTPLLAELSSSVMEFRSVGSAKSRVEKLRAISVHPVTHGLLDVCVSFSSGRNCSRCWKCRRTMAALEVAGLLETFGSSFRLGKWTKDREYYWRFLQESDYPPNQEIFEHARQEGFSLPALPSDRAWRRMLSGGPTWLERAVRLAPVVPSFAWHALSRILSRRSVFDPSCTAHILERIRRLARDRTLRWDGWNGIFPRSEPPPEEGVPPMPPLGL
jgi:hypothetical protein